MTDDPRIGFSHPGSKKSLDDHFRDWEGDAFGFGYGTGERPILSALRQFQDLCHDDDCYDYEVLEVALTPTVAWLLINVLCRVHVLEYGTSPRGAWLTEQGRALKTYVTARSVDELHEVAAGYSDEYSPCYPDACNCGPNEYEEGRVCDNPFWERRQ